MPGAAVDRSDGTVRLCRPGRPGGIRNVTALQMVTAQHARLPACAGLAGLEKVQS